LCKTKEPSWEKDLEKRSPPASSATKGMRVGKRRGWGRRDLGNRRVLTQGKKTEAQKNKERI